MNRNARKNELITIDVHTVKKSILSLLLGATALLCCGAADLMIRRRHDRNRSGVDCLILLALLEIGYVAFILHLIPIQPLMILLGVAGLVLLYLLVMLAILPGSKGANRYGPPPRGD